MTEIVNDRFQLLKKCGTGGTGEVYEALDLRLKRKVALKRVRRDSKGNRQEKAQRLLKEAEYLALVQHPNVVTVHDVIEAEDCVSLILELVEGTPFQDLHRKRPIAENDLFLYLRQLVAALERAHEVGVVHRDVNPRNVLVSPEGVLKLTDFGLATSVDDPEPRAGGSIGYMAPEAFRRGARVGFGVDIYGLGMLAYRAVLGTPGFQRLYGTVEPVEWARWLLSRERFKTLADLGAPVSPALSALVEKMIEKDPAQRYQKITEVKKDLDTVAAAGSRRPPAPEGPSLASAVRRLLPAILARPQDKSHRPPPSGGA